MVGRSQLCHAIFGAENGSGFLFTSNYGHRYWGDARLHAFIAHLFIAQPVHSQPLALWDRLYLKFMVGIEQPLFAMTLRGCVVALIRHSGWRAEQTHFRLLNRGSLVLDIWSDIFA